MEPRESCSSDWILPRGRKTSAVSFLTEGFALHSEAVWGPCTVRSHSLGVKVRLWSLKGPLPMLKASFGNPAYLQISDGGEKPVATGCRFPRVGSFALCFCMPHLLPRTLVSSRNESLLQGSVAGGPGSLPAFFAPGHVPFAVPSWEEARCLSRRQQMSPDCLKPAGRRMTQPRESWSTDWILRSGQTPRVERFLTESSAAHREGRLGTLPCSFTQLLEKGRHGQRSLQGRLLVLQESFGTLPTLRSAMGVKSPS